MRINPIFRSGAFPVIIAVFFVVVTLLSLSINLDKTHKRYEEFATLMGRTLLEQHLVTRKWNAIHGGIYVPVTEKFEPNPYLAGDPQRDLTTTEGIELTKINPAYMTRLISELLSEGKDIKMHLANLRPINPQNMTDPLETEALKSFVRGEKEEFHAIPSGSPSMFRYVAPLKIKEECLGCHERQGFKRGDIGGIISVSFPYGPFQDAIAQSVKTIHAAHILFLGIGILLVAGTFWDMTRRRRTEEKLRRNYETQEVLKLILQTSLLPVSLEEQLEKTLDLIFEYPWIVPIQKGCIFLVDEEQGSLVMKVHRGFSEAVLETCSRVSFDRCVCGRTASTGNVQFCHCPSEIHDVTYPGMVPHSHYCVPLVSADSVLGVLNIYLEAGHKKDRDEEEFLISAANALAGLIRRKQAEENLLQLATAVERAGEIILITDAEGTIQYVNPAFEQVTGYMKEEVVGKNPRILKSGKHDSSFYRDLWETLIRGDAWHGRFTNRKKDGTLYYEETTISPNRDQSGKIINFVAVKHDITHEVALENQLRHAQKMEAVGQLAGGVAHDFNNILTAIIGYASFLKMKMREDDPLEGYVTNILASSERAADLTQGLLAFSRKQIINPKPVNVNSVVIRVGKLLIRLIGEDIELRIELSEQDLVVMADSGQVEQVLVNLATNARDAMPDGGVLSVKTEHVVLDAEFIKAHGYGNPGKYARISATDTGFGMDRETREKIFEPFFTRKEIGRGTGLGLAIVYGIIKQHGGYINVESEPGMGATFNIYLPLTEMDVKVSENQETPMPLVGRETVLVAEDDGEVRKLITGVLEKFGYRVVEATDGADAVAKFKENSDNIDLIILDVVMPKKNGKEAFDELRGVRPDVKALFMSGYASDIIYKKGLVAEGLRLLSKPISPGELLNNVREALDS